jgi:shikimate kinase
MMGSGKTAVGLLLAERTGWPYHDNDVLLDRLFAATPRQIFCESGAERLRATESAAHALGLDTTPPSIVGAAAGTILDPAARHQLRERGIIVFLRATPQTLEARAMGAPHRAELETGGGAWIRAAVRERDALYQSVADETIDTDERSTDEVAETILARLPRFEACWWWLHAQS